MIRDSSNDVAATGENMSDKVKVLHAITRLDKGGSSENTLLSAVGLARKGYQVDVLFGDTQDANMQLMHEAKKIGVDFIEESDLVRNIHPIKDLCAFLNIVHFLRDKKYDIVHAHSSKAGLICRAAAKMAGVKTVIYTPHGHVFYGYFGKGLIAAIIFVEKMAAHVTDAIIGLTQAECDEWLSYGIGKRSQYTAIPSGIDFGRLDREIVTDRDLRAELGVADGKTLIGSIGRFVDIKGYRYFIDAAAAIARKRDDVCFVLAGDGPLRDEYKAMISAAGLEEKFHLIGWQAKAANLIGAMDIFVLSSLNEGMGRVIIEAMYLGRPVVATKVGGVPSVVSEDTGILIEPGSAAAIEDACSRLIEDPKRAREMGRRAHERAINGYSSDKMVEDQDALYKRLLSERGKRHGGKKEVNGER
jgi:glycosyltransferase involved in cell wall biosynthesis